MEVNSLFVSEIIIKRNILEADNYQFSIIK